MAVNYFQAEDSFRNLFLQDGGVIAAPPNTTSFPTPTGAGQTIPTNQGLFNVVNPSGACTAAILQAGTYNYQLAVIVNIATTVANTITFSTTLGTGLVLTDSTPDANVIKAASCAVFVWIQSLNGGNGAWVRQGPFGG